MSYYTLNSKCNSIVYKRNFYLKQILDNRQRFTCFRTFSEAVDINTTKKELIPGKDFKLVYSKDALPGVYPPTEEYLQKIKDYTLPPDDINSPLYDFRYILSKESTVDENDKKNTIRIAHITDLHYLDQDSIQLPDLLGKKAIGQINLHVFKRIKTFSNGARRAILEQVIKERPDLVVITGDITNFSNESEFIMARKELQPILDQFPTFIIPGNHDYYDSKAEKYNYMVQYFGPWMNQTKEEYSKDFLEKNEGYNFFKNTYKSLPIMKYNNILIIGLDPTESHILSSSGTYKEYEQNDLKELLNPIKPFYGIDINGRQYPDNTYPDIGSKYHNPLKNKCIILATHYPVLNRKGKDHNVSHKLHSITNNHELINIQNTSQIKPNLIIHGHDHDGYMLPFYSIPCERYIESFNSNSIYSIDKKNRQRLVKELTNPNITLEEFKLYGASAKKKKLELFDRYNFPIKYIGRYIENDLSYRKRQFNIPRTRTYDNKGIQRKFYEHSIPFTICNPGSASLSYKEPTKLGHKIRQASFVIYNITDRSKEGAVTTTVADDFDKTVKNDKDFVYQGQSNYDIYIQRWVCDENNKVYEQNKDEQFQSKEYNLKDILGTFGKKIDPMQYFKQTSKDTMIQRIDKKIQGFIKIF